MHQPSQYLPSASYQILSGKPVSCPSKYLYCPVLIASLTQLVARTLSLALVRWQIVVCSLLGLPIRPPLS